MKLRFNPERQEINANGCEKLPEAYFRRAVQEYFLMFGANSYRMKKTILSILFLVSLISAQSQNSSRVFYDVILNKGVGFELQDINYDRVGLPTSELIYYSFGGGTALDGRIGVNLFSGFALSAGGNYRLVYISKSENFGNAKNKSRATVALKSASSTLHYSLRTKTPDLWLTGATFGAGADYYFPSTLKRKKNSETLKDIQYKETTGFHLEAMLTFVLFPEDKIEMMLGVKYHYVSYDAKETPDREVLNKIDGQGMDFRIGIRGELF